MIASLFRGCFCIRRTEVEGMSDPEDNMNEMENGHIMEVVHIAGNESNDEDASSSSADSGTEFLKN